MTFKKSKTQILLIMSFIFLLNMFVYADEEIILEVNDEEIFQTEELGNEIGQDKASQLIKMIKEEIKSDNIKDSEDIKRIILEISDGLDIDLKLDQIDKISTLMKKINKVNINTEEMQNQIQDIGEKIEDVVNNNEEVKSFLGRILDAIKEFFRSIFN